MMPFSEKRLLGAPSIPPGPNSRPAWQDCPVAHHIAVRPAEPNRKSSEKVCELDNRAKCRLGRRPNSHALWICGGGAIGSVFRQIGCATNIRQGNPRNMINMEFHAKQIIDQIDMDT